MAFLNEDIEKQYKFCKNNEDIGTKYYYDIFYGFSNNESEISVVSHLATNPAPTGADNFLKICDNIKSMGGDFIVVKYFRSKQKNNPDAAVPYFETRIPISEQAKPLPAVLSGFDTREQLEGFIASKSREISEGYKREIDLRMANEKIQELLQQNSNLRAMLKRAKRDRDQSEQEAKELNEKSEKYKEQASMGVLITKGIAGVVFDKIGINEKTLAGIFPSLYSGAAADNAHDTQSMVPATTEGVEIEEDSETPARKVGKELAKWVNQIQNSQQLQDIYKVFLFISKSPQNLKDIVGLIDNK